MLLLPWLLLLLSIWVSDERRNLTVAWHDYILFAGTIIAVAGAIAWFILPREKWRFPTDVMDSVGGAVFATVLHGAIDTGTLTMADDADITRIRTPAALPATR